METIASDTTLKRDGEAAQPLVAHRWEGGARNSFRIRPPDFSPEHAHGNNVATLSRAGTGYAVNDRRSYDAWGVVRAQQSGGDPKLRYCASLGHKQDDESGLVYMRARYYEPSSGRFVSEDPAKHGWNWFAYCGNNPINYVDQAGTVSALAWDVLFAGAFGLVEFMLERFGIQMPKSIQGVMLLLKGTFIVMACLDAATVSVVAGAASLGTGNVAGAGLGLAGWIGFTVRALAAAYQTAVMLAIFFIDNEE